MDIEKSKIEQAAAQQENSSRASVVGEENGYGAFGSNIIHDVKFRMRYGTVDEYRHKKELVKEYYRKKSVNRVLVAILRERSSGRDFVLGVVDSLIDSVPEEYPDCSLYLRDVLHEWEEALNLTSPSTPPVTP